MAWNPIKTAPKTGLTRILVSDGKRVREAYWSKSGDLGHGYWNIDGNGSFVNPTHWMSLPFPPLPSSASERGDA